MNRMIYAALAAAALLSFPVEARGQGARDYTIQGTVLREAAGQPLPGVQVNIVGTRFGTLTDGNGRYRLTATLPPGEQTLSFSFIGRRTASVPITLGTETTITVDPVVLDESAVQLDEIVVTGTGTPTQKRAIGNTVSTVSAAEINNSPGATAVDVALQGKVTGAVISENSGQPGGGVSIRLRGTSSIQGGAEPLIVIDGVIVDNSSAALISLGANAGRGNASLTNRLSDISPDDIERIEVVKGAAAAALYGSQANNGVIQIFTKRGRQGAPRIRLTTEVSAASTPGTYDLMMHPEGTLADVIWGTAAFVGDTVERFDYQDEIFRTGIGNKTHLSVSGGTENTTYYMSGGFTEEVGIVRGSDYQKLDARASIGQLVTDWLNVRASGQVIETDGQFVPEGEQTQGVLTTIIFTPTSWVPFFNEETGRFPYNPILGQNPFDVIENWDASDDVTRFLGSFEATARPTDELTVRYLFGYDDYRQENRYLQPPFSRNASFGGEINNPVRFSRQINHDMTLNHEWGLSRSLHLTSTAGTRYTDDESEVISSTARGLPPGQELVGGATLITGQSLVELRTFGAFLQERLSFSDRLYLTGGFNYEASSAFGEDERWQLFPRASVSYLLHEEPAFINAVGGLLSTIRLRAAFGQTGGQPPGVYDRFANYFDVAYAGRPGVIASTLAPNRNLKPERQTELETGFEIGFWDDRALVDFTYYTQTTEDLVLSVPLQPSSGFQARRENIGELTNRGVELALSTINIARDNFTWRSRLQFSTNENEVTKLVTNADTLVSGYLNAVIEGQPVGVFYGGIWARTNGELSLDAKGLPFRARDTINVAMCDLANKVSSGCPFAARILGDPNPDWTASLSNDLQIGDALTFSFLLDGRFGNDVANFTRRITEFFGTDAAVEKERTGEVPERFYALNPNGRIGVYEEYVEDGSFVKLREIALGYRFGHPWVQRFGAESVGVRIAARDLYTWTRYSGLDPEINLFSANTVARGVDFATTPIPRKLIVGLDFNF